MRIFEKLKKSLRKFTGKSDTFEQGARRMDMLLGAAGSGDLETLEQYFKQRQPRDTRDSLAEWMLLAACTEGQEKSVRFLLDKGVPPDAQGLSGNYAIDAARKEGHHVIVGILEDAIRVRWEVNPEEDEEVARMKKMSVAVSSLQMNISQYFFSGRKDIAFADAYKIEDQERMSFGWGPEKPEIIPLLDGFRLNDVFMRAARRVEDDATLASMLPPVHYEEKDAEILEKKNLSSLAAVVRARIDREKKQ